MKKTDERYADGRIKYLHKCIICKKEEAVGPKNKKNPKCYSCGEKKHQYDGISKHIFYHKWTEMKRRCTNKKHKEYKYWGGRGISIHEPWLEKPKAYIEYISSLPNAGEKGLSIDRIDNNGNYEPGNLRWATHKEQALNQRKRQTNTGEPSISYDKNIKRFRIGKGKVFKTLEEAVSYRDYNGL